MIQIVEEFIKNYPFSDVVQNSIAMLKKIIPYCDSKLLHYMSLWCGELQVYTFDYHLITRKILPYVKLHIKLYKQIISSLLNESPDIELIYRYVHGKFKKSMI